MFIFEWLKDSINSTIYTRPQTMLTTSMSMGEFIPHSARVSLSTLNPKFYQMGIVVQLLSAIPRRRALDREGNSEVG
jgi:hypothetical protein